MSDNMGWGMAKSLFAGIGCMVFFFVAFLIFIAFMAGTNFHR